MAGQDLTAAVERVREVLERAEPPQKFGRLTITNNVSVRPEDLRALLSAVTWRPISEYDAKRDGAEILVGGRRAAGKAAGTWLRAVAKFDKVEGAWVAFGAPVRVTEIRAMITKPEVFLPLPPPPEAK